MERQRNAAKLGLAAKIILNSFPHGPTSMSPRDPYSRHGDLVREPPATLWQAVPYVGPGFILSASIVGSGELIATTTLGAEVGFIALWVILLGCLVKVALQIEFGRHTILHGTTVIEALNAMPGPSWRGVRWGLWLWLTVWPLKLLQMGGIVGTVAVLMELMLPLNQWLDGWGIIAWAWIMSLGVAWLVSAESYKGIEKTCIVFLVLFTVLTLASVAMLAWTPYALQWSDIASGLTFELPRGGLMLAVVGAFGLIGVGGDEVMQYTYWLLEKGYAAYTGPRDDTPEWRSRALGWIKVMQLDALLSMVAYTVVTIAFYLLGAAVLHARGEVPANDELVGVLQTMYTESLGRWASWVFLIGAWIVLVSTLFSALAAWARNFADALAHFSSGDFRNPVWRRLAVKSLTWGFAIVWALIFLCYQAPVTMVQLGGVAASFILLLVVVMAIWFRWFDTPRGLIPSRFYDGALVVSCLSITAIAIYSVIKLFL